MRESRACTHRVRKCITAFFSTLLLVAPAVAQAQTVTAAWDPSPAADQVTGYQVCVGTSSLSCNVALASVSASTTNYTFTPSGGALYYIAIRATNAAGASPYSSEVVFSIPGFTQPLNQSSQAGTAITPLNLSVSDPDGDSLTFTHTGLPPGLSLNGSTGRITGTPSAAGTYNVTVFVGDGLVTVSRSLVWTVTGTTSDTTAPALTITSHSSGQTLTSASVTISGTATDSGRGGNGVTSVTVNGQTATGGTVSTSNTSNWSRAVTLSSGANTISVEATDGAGNSNMQQITLNVNLPIAPVTGATLTANIASPEDAGTTITFTAAGSGGVGPRQYKFLVAQGGGSAQMVQNWSTTSTYSWTPSTAATYTVSVWVRSAGVTTDAAQASAQMSYVINTPPPSPVAAASLSVNLASPRNTGTAITFTATGSGGVGPRQYKFLVSQGGGAAQTVQNWSTTATYTWIPTTAASYTVSAWVRSAGVTLDVAQASAQMAYVVSGPLTLTGPTSNVPSPQPRGTTITLSASATGGVGPHQYKWWLYDGSAWVTARDWSTTAQLNWTPTSAGTYRVGVWIRNAGVTTDAAQANAGIDYIVTSSGSSSSGGGGTSPSTLSLTSFTGSVASPQTAGTAITFTPIVAGGAAPYQYKYWLFNGTTWTVARDWSTTAQLTWTPAQAGSYRIGVWVRGAGVTADAAQANLGLDYAIAAPSGGGSSGGGGGTSGGSLTFTSLSTSQSSPAMVGQTVTITPTVSGGTSPYQYKYWLFDGTSWTVGRDWTTTAQWTWTPTRAGSYRVGVWVRSAGVTVDAPQVNSGIDYTVTSVVSIQLQAVGMAPVSPTVGAVVAFSAVAAGGAAPYQYKFWLFDGATWTVIRNWGSSNTATWTAQRAGNYRMGVWVRSAGVTADAPQHNSGVDFTVR